MFVPPEAPPDEPIELLKGPNIVSLPELEPVPDALEVPVLLVVGDDISTDEIMPAGARVLPFRSNVPELAEFAFDAIDESYPERAKKLREQGGHAVVGGDNYGQGSSREHAALAPRYLGLRLVLAGRFARIHHQNLVDFGVLPLRIRDEDREKIEPEDVLVIEHVHEQLRAGGPIEVTNRTREHTFEAQHDLSDRQVEVLCSGGIINWMADRLAAQ